METFLNFYFWWLAFGLAVQAITICVRDYPYVKKKTVGEDIFSFILIGVFFLWLLFIRLGVVQ